MLLVTSCWPRGIVPESRGCFAGISACEELKVDDIRGGTEGEQAQAALAEAAWKAVSEEYQRLLGAINDPSKRDGFQQPWREA